MVGVVWSWVGSGKLEVGVLDGLMQKKSECPVVSGFTWLDSHVCWDNIDGNDIYQCGNHTTCSVLSVTLSSLQAETREMTWSSRKSLDACL